MNLKKQWKIGNIRNGYPVLAPKDRRCILLLSDDLRMHSGIATMSREFVLGTIHYFNWIQLAASIKHPELGKIIDMNKTVQDETGVEDAQLKLYPMDGYGNPDVLREIIVKEKPDGILHYTDPRFWGWLYSMENEIRQNIPIMYYNIWDDPPYPKYNREYYRSCDLIMNISKQTLNLVNCVLGDKKENIITTYVPHGINSNIFKPIFDADSNYVTFKKSLLGDKEYDFIIFYNNRNIRRKMPSDLMVAYKMFCNTLTKEQTEKCLLIYHTQPIDNNGTDLFAVQKALCPEYNIKFSTKKYPSNELNYLYNIADVTWNCSSAEGFGLAPAESLMAGTPIIATVEGGLQDQMAFRDENNELIKLTPDFPSNSCGKYTKYGKWAFPCFPQSNLVGSPPTPYIYDSRANIKDQVKHFITLYKMEKEKREELGLAGREWMLSDESMLSATWMSQLFIKDMDNCMKKFKPKERFGLYKAAVEKADNSPKGIWNEYEEKWI